MNQNNSSVPPPLFDRKLADLEQRGYAVIGRILHKDGEYALFDSSCRWLTRPQYQRLMHEQDGSLFATQPPADHVQVGNLNVSKLVELDDPELDAKDPFTRVFLLAEYWQREARKARSALAYRVQGGLTDWLAVARKHGYAFPDKRMEAFVTELLSRQSMMGSEVRGEIDERAVFEKFMSKRGWAAVYAGDGQYESPSVQDQWEAWQARAGIAAPQVQAERPGVPGGFVFVPSRATKEMLHAGMRHFHDKTNPASRANEIYAAMLAAAPSPQEGNAPVFDQAEFDTMVAAGTKAWAGVPDSFVEELRSNSPTTPTTPANAAAANGDGRNSGCRMTGGICACRSGGSFGGCARERSDCCINEPARAPAADADGQKGDK